jgi:CHAD domain-containing protein
VVAARAAIGAAARAIRERAPGVRDGRDPEDLHKVRVASRRLRAALATYAPLFRRRERKARAREVRRFTRALGALREADVHAALLAAAFAGARGDGAARARAQAMAAIERRRGEERKAVLEAVAPAKLDRLGRRLARLRLRRRLAQRRLDLETLAAEALERGLTRAFGGLAASLDEERDEALHARRIAVKRLRYAIEALGPALPLEPAAALLELAKRIQEVLGRHHDLVTLAARLEDERGRAPDPAAARALAAAAARLRARASAAFAEFQEIARTAIDVLPGAALEARRSGD